MSARSMRLSGRRRRLAGVGVALGLVLLVPATALAHPLGNFTINHFAAIRVAPSRIALDVVIDRAEIPAFQEQQQLDLDRDGTLSPTELETARQAACGTLASDLHLSVDGAAIAPIVVAAGISLPPGAGGLPTMRLVCEYEAALASPIGAATTIAFEDRSFAERIGWREIVVLGDGVSVDAGGPATADGAGVSNRLTKYPVDLLTQPLNARSISVSVTPGGAALGAWSAPDAQPLAALAAAPGSGPNSAVPGGIAEDLAALVDVTDLTPLAILVSLAIALALGAIHALSPGHGKTIMAAYLVGAKGSSRQALALGLAVAVSHTLGVLVLAGITLAASSILPPERLYPILGVVSGALVVAIGGSLLWSRLRALGLGSRGNGRTHTHDHAADHGHEHGHPHSHAQPHEPAAEHGHDHGTHSQGDHDHGHPHGHTHAPADATISWRGLLALGLSGGLVPSASALILLLGSIAAGRVAYGLVLVLGFGFGMAVVLGGVGLVIVNARQLVARRPSTLGFQRIVAPLQLATASLVVVLGVVLTGQALTQVL